MRADDVRRRCIHEIPVVHVPRVREVGVEDSLLPGWVGSSVALDEEHDREQALLVPLRREHLVRVRQGQLTVHTRETAQPRDPYAKEPVALTILAGAGLEEPLQVYRVVSVRLGAKVTPNGAERSLDHSSRVAIRE